MDSANFVGEKTPAIERKMSDGALSPGSAMSGDLNDPGMPSDRKVPGDAEPGLIEEEERYDELLDVVSDDEDAPEAKRVVAKPAPRRQGSRSNVAAGPVKHVDTQDFKASPAREAPRTLQHSESSESNFDPTAFRKASLERLQREQWWAGLPEAQKDAVLKKQEEDERKRLAEKKRRDDEEKARLAEIARLEEEAKRIRVEVEGQYRGSVGDQTSPRSAVAPAAAARQASEPQSAPTIARTTTPAATSHPASLVAQASKGQLNGAGQAEPAAARPAAAPAKPQEAKGCCVML